jgi:glutathione S-transferase
MSAAAQEQGIRLYELALGNGVQPSPFVWRVRFALAHKGLLFETVPLGFTEIPRVLGPDLKTVPVLEDRNGRRAESWDIVEYLEREHPARPLFAAPGELELARFFDAWFSIEITRRMFALYALDVCNAARPEDREYYRANREARIGQTLEAFTADREARVPGLREALEPLRWHLKRTPFISGEAPGYSDYIALGGFLWVASVSTLPLLAKDDPLGGWLDRGLALYGGMARDPLLKPLSE